MSVDTSRAVGICAFLVVSCCSPSDRDVLILDLNFYSPIVSYALSGRQDRLNVPICMGTRAAREVTARYVVLNESLSSPGMTARALVGGEIIHFPFAPFLANDLRLAPSGRGLAFAGQATWEIDGCRSGIAIASSGAAEWERLWCSPHEGQNPSSVSWSSDERRISFAFMGQIYTMDLTTREARPLVRGEWARYSPVDARMAYVDGENVVVIPNKAHVSEGKQMKIPGLIASGVEWSVTGDMLSIVHRSEHQPGDSRIATELGVLDVARWGYRDLGVHMWGETARLRWIVSMGDPLGRLASFQAAACSTPPPP